MQPLVQIGVRCGEFLDTFIREQNALRYPRIWLVFVVKNVRVCLHLAFRRGSHPCAS